MGLTKEWCRTWQRWIAALGIMGGAMLVVMVLAKAADAELSAKEASCIQTYATSKRLRTGARALEQPVLAEAEISETPTKLRTTVPAEETPAEIPEPSSAPLPEDLTTGKIWTGWCRYEGGYGEASYYQTGGGGGYSYGRYQFDIRFSVAQFLGTCIDTGDPVYTAEFAPFVAHDGKGYVLVTDAGLGEAWKRVCDMKGSDFFQRQTNFAMNHYYRRVERRLLDIYSIDLNNYSAVLKGTVWSISVRDGSSVNLDPATNNLSSVTDTYREGIDEAEWLNAIYDAETARHPDQADRWDNKQRNLALEYLAELQAGNLNANALAPL